MSKSQPTSPCHSAGPRTSWRCDPRPGRYLSRAVYLVGTTASRDTSTDQHSSALCWCHESDEERRWHIYFMQHVTGAPAWQCPIRADCKERAGGFTIVTRHGLRYYCQGKECSKIDPATGRRKSILYQPFQSTRATGRGKGVGCSTSVSRPVPAGLKS